MVFEKDGEDLLGRSCVKWTIKSQKDETNILRTIKRRMANWVGHFFRRDDRRDEDTRKKA